MKISPARTIVIAVREHFTGRSGWRHRRAFRDAGTAGNAIGTRAFAPGIRTTTSIPRAKPALVPPKIPVADS